MSEGQKALEMRLAGGKFTDLYPWELTLEEGLSRLYTGRLTALSNTKHTAEELSAFVDKGISVTIREKLLDTKTDRTRYFCGIVTAVSCEGVFCGANKADCYTYTFVIEPEIARLKYTRLSEPYYKMNPADIFEKILEKYKITAKITENYFKRGQYSRNLMFDQSSTPDYSFIDAIARLYGISLVLTHPAVSPGALGAAEVYFSTGEKFPVSALAYSDKRSEPDALQFDFLRADERNSVWRMDKFSVTPGIGVDGFKVNAMYPDSNYGSDNWKQGKTVPGSRYIVYRGLFHGYAASTETGEVDADMDLILTAKTRAAEQGKKLLKGSASNIAIRPGVLLELRHFYGQSDNTVNTVLVTGITLRRRALWPSDLAVWAEDAGGEITEVEFEGIDWGGGAVKRFCPPAVD
ncbi:MAG: phage late control D family protein [Spirochaetaceae bacterium]|jgi:hypothetical protein|nr:phage late control D family protein [Spirochaetaceae bacterium]